MLLDNIERQHESGAMPDWIYYQLCDKSPQESYIEQKQKMRERYKKQMIERYEKQKQKEEEKKAEKEIEKQLEKFVEKTLDDLLKDFK